MRAVAAATVDVGRRPARESWRGCPRPGQLTGYRPARSAPAPAQSARWPFPRNPPSAVLRTRSPGTPRTTAQVRHLTYLMTARVSAETLRAHPEISFRSRGHPAHGHRTELPGRNQAQDRRCKRLLLRLGGGHIQGPGRNIGIEALIAQLVIQRCLTHPRHRRDTPAKTSSTTCGQPPQTVKQKWTSCARHVGSTEQPGPLRPTGNAA